MVKITIEELDRQIERASTAEAQEQIKKLTAEEKEKNRIERDLIRRKYIFGFYKEFTGNEMLEEDYQEYLFIYDNPKTRKYFNLKNFIDGDKGKILDEQVEDILNAQPI